MSSYTPDGHNAVSPYLLVESVAQELEFLLETFNAKLLCKIDGPNNSVKHAEIKIDDSVIMLGERPNQGLSVISSIHVYVKSVDEVYERALASGATSISEPTNQAYGDRSAGVKDPQGNFWWIGTHTGKANI
ncbi:VOC family protein [Mangrovitalea sediminis]|uniref:VOC family protein n=1 Tax=Mangrovitalea sediminis TaxID=1982043 RepID=UPI0011787B39|nr:VOC family protein [Mangrovitalea sediminis]